MIEFNVTSVGEWVSECVPIGAVQVWAFAGGAANATAISLSCFSIVTMSVVVTHIY